MSVYNETERNQKSMRIGQVSRKYNIPTDTIYYYIRYGLLVPPRPNSQYYFDDQTLRDLDLVLELKEMDFSLPEIHRILSLQRISGLTDEEDVREVIRMYSEKRAVCVAERLRREKMIEKMDSRIQELTQKIARQESHIGLPIRMLELLCCPKCGGTLQISDVDMNLCYIFQGELECECGYHAQVREGILLTPNKNTNKDDKPDVNRELYKDLPPSLISLFQRSYNWMVKKLETIELKDKVVMETYVNAWFFMHNHQQYLEKDGKYIVVDKYPETLAMYKKIIEQQNYQLDILYIADSSTNLPLKKECVDVNLDFFAANEHNFYRDTFIYEDFRPYYHKNTQMLGTYFYFENGPKSIREYLKCYSEAYKWNFSRQYFIEEMKKSGYRINESEDCGFTTDSGNNLGFGFHVKGEKMHLMPYLAELI